MAVGHTAAFVRGIALASGTRSAPLPSKRTARRSSPTLHAPPDGWPAKWKTDSGSWSRPGWLRPTDSKTCAPCSIPSVGPDRAGRTVNGLVMHPVDGRCLRHTGTAPDGNAETFARQLLLRWGVVFRDAAHKETLAHRGAILLVVAASNGSARRNPRRPVCGRLPRRAVSRCPRRSTCCAPLRRKTAVLATA